jgi:type I restriction enzyme, S subunit
VKAGWEIAKLDDVTFIQEGPGIRKYEYEEGGFPMINVRCVQDGYIDMSSARAANRELAVGKWKHFQVDEGDILFTISGTIGRCAIVQEHDLPLLMNTSVVRFRPTDPDLESQYLYYFLQSDGFQLPLEGLSSGTAIKNVGPTHIKTLSIPLPPLDEQKRIVAVLDAAFEGLSRARAHTETNLQNARELFESFAGDAFSTAAETGRDVLLGDVASIPSALVDPRDEPFCEMPHVGAGNMETGKDELFGVKTARDEKLISGKYTFDASMILYSKIRPYLRKVTRPTFDGLCSADVYPLKPKPNALDKNYLFHLLLAPDFTEYAISGSDRTGMPKVNREHLFAYKFGLPSVETQTEVAARIDAAMVECEQLQSHYRAKLADLDALRQSLLQKAFAGELT